jgi:hypothetical protein
MAQAGRENGRTWAPEGLAGAGAPETCKPRPTPAVRPYCKIATRSVRESAACRSRTK